MNLLEILSRFDFETADSIIYDESFDRSITCKKSGKLDAILMWWDLDMDGTGKFWIDMAPKWANNAYHWRDHWMQAVYYLPHRVNVEKNQKFILKCSHDEFSMWFCVGEEYISYYKFANVNVVKSTADVSADQNVIIGEPFYLSAMTPWQNLRFWYDVQSLKKRLGSSTEIYPQTATLYGMCERFDHLQNTAAPVGEVNGFDLSLFDDLSQKARLATTALVDNHPLWEYGGVATSDRFEVLRFDLQEDPHDLHANFKIDSLHDTNGIPLWMEWHFGNYSHSTGLKHESKTGESPAWKEGVRQGVYLLSPALLQQKSIRIDARFDSKIGEVSLQFY
ncbi:unnamed protein product [Strongylus vulgaris]|uniref:Protein arginine N-methyltransferase domain-containing protein n=1 Tax=Strongylus vulgaris TaxID=40348 RepID=A0A3P7L7G4_STRVU|nr:unnamed protein product [Strongylus vulgaris]